MGGVGEIELSFYTCKGHNLRFSHQGHIAEGRIFPGTASVGNVVQDRDHDAELALSGPREGALNSQAKSQITDLVKSPGFLEVFFGREAGKSK